MPTVRCSGRPGGVLPGGGCLPMGGVSAQGKCLPSGVSAKGVSAQGVSAQGGVYPEEGCLPYCMLGYTPPCGQNEKRL